MIDELAPQFDGLGEARPLPAHLRERLERVLVAEAEVGVGALATLDAPRPLPAHIVDRIESAMVVAADVGPMPVGLRRRLERSLVPRRHPVGRVLSAAAVLLVLAGAAALLGDPPRPPQDRSHAGGSALQGNDPVTDLPIAGGDVGGDAGGVDSPSSGALTAGAAGAATSVRGYYHLPYPAPPFYDEGQVAGSVESLSVSGGTQATPLPPPPRDPLRIGIAPGDPVQEKGFRAYIDLVNARGGAGGRRLDLVPHHSPGTVATVNLSGAPLADAVGPPAGLSTPLLESLDVLEPALRDDVYSLTGVVERQAHLAVEAAGVRQGERAVVYVARSGAFAGRVPAAFEEALRRHGVPMIKVEWDPNRPPPLVPADAAFVSLPTTEARSWLNAARGSGYNPPKGMWGIWSLADESLVDAMPADLQLLAPYTFTRGDELAALVNATGEVPSARLVHGWITAKWLAVAVWKAGDKPVPLGRHLRNSYFQSGFAPIYETRGQTNSRTPEAVVLAPEGGRLEPKGPFRTDNAF